MWEEEGGGRPAGSCQKSRLTSPRGVVKQLYSRIGPEGQWQAQEVGGVSSRAMELKELEVVHYTQLSSPKVLH